MKPLIVINGTTSDSKIIDFSAQFVHRADEAPVILLVMKHGRGNTVMQAQKILEEANNRLGIPGTTLTFRIGQPFEEIIRETNKVSCSLVILGEWPRSWLKRFFRKPISVKVAETINCPILILKGEKRTVKKILLCDSGAGKSSVLSRFIVQLSDLMEGEEEVTVLHVMSQMSAGPGVIGKELKASAEELIEEHTLEGKLLHYDVQELSHPGLHAVPKVRHGLVVDEILSEAHGGNYDLLVIGAHSTQTMKGFLLENIAEEILLQSDRPVLVVR